MASKVKLSKATKPGAVTVHRVGEKVDLGKLCSHIKDPSKSHSQNCSSSKHRWTLYFKVAI